MLRVLRFVCVGIGVAAVAWVMLKPGPTPAASLLNKGLLLPMLGAAASLTWRARGANLAERSCVFANALVFASATLLYAIHTGAVLTLLLREEAGYDFRTYSLLMLGVVALVPAVGGLQMALRSSRGTPPLRLELLRNFGGLLAINIPLIPLQDFAIALSAAGVAALVLQLGTPTRSDRQY